MTDKVIKINKKAGFNYEIIDKFEAGIKLTGSEVKSAKLGFINLSGSYISIATNKNGKSIILLKNCSIARYKKSGYSQKDYNPLRDRVLLLGKREISTLLGKLTAKGLTIIPLSVYTKRRLIKLEVALVKGKSKIDKRDTIKKREIDRRLRQQLNS